MFAALKKRLKNYLQPAVVVSRVFNQKIKILSREINVVKELVARQQIQHIKSLGVVENLSEVEFKVYSQAGEDGIIQYLIHHIKNIPNTFIEFGVENYNEANTRFLLSNNNWSGLVMDGSERNVATIKANEIYVKYDLHAKAAFITAENINALISSSPFTGEIGLLSIDIDGNDYWVWDSINVINPVIIICEYNSVFGNSRAISIPYKKDFYVKNQHYSNLYFGASLPALVFLAEKKGYVLVGSNSNGSNAFFVRKDKVEILKVHTAESCFVDSKFRSSRNEEGTLSYLWGTQRLEAIKGMPVMNVIANQIEKL